MMNRTSGSAAESAWPASSDHVLAEAGRILGGVPPLLQSVAHCPMALAWIWEHVASVRRPLHLPVRTRLAIGLRVAELNGCPQSAAVIQSMGEGATLDAASVQQFRRGQSPDPREWALLALTTKIVKDRGQHAGFVVDAARKLGVGQEELVEAMALIALYSFTHYLRCVVGDRKTGQVGQYSFSPDNPSCGRAAEAK